jgi:hypothetical protein
MYVAIVVNDTIHVSKQDPIEKIDAVIAALNSNPYREGAYAKNIEDAIIRLKDVKTIGVTEKIFLRDNCNILCSTLKSDKEGTIVAVSNFETFIDIHIQNRTEDLFDAAFAVMKDHFNYETVEEIYNEFIQLRNSLTDEDPALQIEDLETIAFDYGILVTAAMLY